MSNVPAGYYPAMAVPIDVEGTQMWAQFGESKNKGTKQVLLHFEILEGEHAGTVMPWFGYFTANSTDRTIESLRVAGFKGDDLAKLVDTPLEQRVTIVVEVEEYDGKTRSKVAWVNRPGGGGMRLEKRMEGNDLKTFAAQLKARVKSKPEVAGEKAERGATAPANGNGSATSSNGGKHAAFCKLEPNHDGECLPF